MKTFFSALHTFKADESGTDLVEYAFAAGLVGTGSIIALKSLDSDILSALSAIGIHFN